MKFLLIVHHDEAAFEKIDKEKRQQMLAESIELTHQLDAGGQYINASPLQSAATAVMVRVRDGPFIETREQIAGYFLINARDLNEAVSIASRVPGARIGTVEVRPLIEIEGLPNESRESRSPLRPLSEAERISSKLRADIQYPSLRDTNDEKRSTE